MLDTLSQEHFTALLDQRVQFIIIATGAVGVIDNARIHYTLASRVVLEEVFDSLYYFLSVNSLFFARVFNGRLSIVCSIFFY